MYYLKIKKNLRLPILALLLIFFLASCSGLQKREKGIWHTWKKQDSLEKLSQSYNVSILDIRVRNDIYDQNDLTPGYKIFIPGARVSAIRQPAIDRKIDKSPYSGKFIWPSGGTISSGYGSRHRRMHTGIDLTRDGGLDILASATGVVSFAGTKRGYGKTLIIKHGSDYETYYAHNAKLYVRKGQKVRVGQVIAKMGSTGRSTGIHLHFEIRYRGKHQNPLRYLPIR